MGQERFGVFVSHSEVADGKVDDLGKMFRVGKGACQPL